MILLKILLLSILFCPSSVFSDAPENWQLGFQDPATPIMEGIINLHHDLMFFLCVILTFVAWMLFRTLWYFEQKQNSLPSSLAHGTLIEMIWTITPAFILLVIAVPSFSLLYAMDEVISPTITIKTVGHQWYWSYEYSDYANENSESIEFDSYMISEEDLTLGQLRLLEVDNRMIVPINTHIRIIVSAADVLHSLLNEKVSIMDSVVKSAELIMDLCQLLLRLFLYQIMFHEFLINLVSKWGFHYFN